MEHKNTNKPINGKSIEEKNKYMYTLYIYVYVYCICICMYAMEEESNEKTNKMEK